MKSFLRFLAARPRRTAAGLLLLAAAFASGNPLAGIPAAIIGALVLTD